MNSLNDCLMIKITTTTYLGLIRIFAVFISEIMKLLLLISEMEGPLQQVQLLNLLLERSMIFTPCPFRFHEASYHHAALSLQL